MNNVYDVFKKYGMGYYNYLVIFENLDKKTQRAFLKDLEKALDKCISDRDKTMKEYEKRGEFYGGTDDDPLRRKRFYYIEEAKQLKHIISEIKYKLYPEEEYSDDPDGLIL